MAVLMKEGKSPESSEMQKLIQRHYEWLKQFWTPDREAYIAWGEDYTGFEWKKFYQKYDAHHPRLAKYQREAMKVFAEENL